MYAHRVWIGRAIQLDQLRKPTSLALQDLAVDVLFEVTAEFFTDVLANFGAFFTTEDYASLAAFLSSILARDHIESLKAGDFSSDALMFAKLLFAYGDASAQDLAKNIEDPGTKQIMQHLLGLLSCDAYPGAEDEVCSLCLEFWMTFTEFLIDSIFTAGNEIPSWMNSAKLYIPQVIKACWIKIQMPRHAVFSTWNSDMRDAFREFRSDVKDLLQSSYTLLGIAIFEEFTKLAIEALSVLAWLELEATLFCLNALSDYAADEDLVDDILSKLFGSSLFESMEAIIPVPTVTRQMAVTLISNYTAFFERHTEYLPAMLNFLFGSLKVPTLANVVARAICSSCWACRKQLVMDIDAFLQQYESLLDWENFEAGIKEKIIGGIAAIMQALPSDEQKVQKLNVLLHFVERDVQKSTKHMQHGEDDKAYNYGICALRCLVSMGKAFQVPDDVVIDLDAQNPPLFLWAQGERGLIQAKITHIMDVITGLFKNDSQVIEAACQVLRTGFKETAPGPFVFTPSVTENFVLSSNRNTARLDYVLDTAGALLARQTNSLTADFRYVATSFLQHALRFIGLMQGLCLGLYFKLNN